MKLTVYVLICILTTTIVLYHILFKDSSYSQKYLLGLLCGETDCNARKLNNMIKLCHLKQFP